LREVYDKLLGSKNKQKESAAYAGEKKPICCEEQFISSDLHGRKRREDTGSVHDRRI